MTGRLGSDQAALAGRLDPLGEDAPSLVIEVDFEDPVHAREGDHESAGARDDATAQAGSGTAPHQRHILVVGEFYQADHLICVARKRHHVGLGHVHAAVVLV